MGAVYAEHVLGVERPTIGVLNVGSEDEKGNDLARAALAMFRNGPAGRPLRRQHRGAGHL